MTEQPLSYADCVDAIESSYEFMLAYAAQGRDREAQAGEGVSIRQYLTILSDALARIGPAAEDVLPDAENAPAAKDFAAQVVADADRAKTAVDLALATPNVSSQLVDNLNASTHVRTILTDLFLFDEALKSFRRKA